MVPFFPHSFVGRFGPEMDANEGRSANAQRLQNALTGLAHIFEGINICMQYVSFMEFFLKFAINICFSFITVKITRDPL